MLRFKEIYSCERMNGEVQQRESGKKMKGDGRETIHRQK